VRGPLLTGSLARGTARADSDLDVLVITSEQATDDGWRSAARPLPANFAARTPRRMARVLRPGPARR
jgi:predicted nucleotidyltransferase